MLIILTIIVIIAYLGLGTFSLLNWQIAPIVWARPIVFIFGCLSFVCVGISIMVLIELIEMDKE